MNSHAGLLEYSRHLIDARGCSEVPPFLPRLSTLGDMIAVNIVGSDGSSAVFCEQHLRMVLATAPATVTLDAIEGAAFTSILTSKLASAQSEAVALRLKLRTEFIVDTPSMVAGLRHQLDQLLLILDGFALQQPSARLKSEVSALLAGRQSLLTAVSAADNVLGMDSLGYEIVPALRSLTKLLSS